MARRRPPAGFQLLAWGSPCPRTGCQAPIRWRLLCIEYFGRPGDAGRPSLPYEPHTIFAPLGTCAAHRDDLPWEELATVTLGAALQRAGGWAECRCVLENGWGRQHSTAVWPAPHTDGGGPVGA